MISKRTKYFTGIAILVFLLGVYAFYKESQKIEKITPLGLFISQWTLLKNPSLDRIGPSSKKLKPEDAKILVLQLKDSDGLIPFKSKVAKRYGIENTTATFDLKTLVTDLKSRGFYVIAYLQVFKDKAFAERFPTEAIKSQDGNIFRDKFGAFVDPSSKKYHKYFRELSDEVIESAFDELMLDYIRFPEYLELTFPLSKDADDATKDSIIANFVGQLRQNLAPKTALSAALFLPGLTVGQNYSLLCDKLNIITPMIYPSSFTSRNAAGQEWIDAFDIHFKSFETLSSDCIRKVRPFLQAFIYEVDKEGGRPVKSGPLPDKLMKHQLLKTREAGMTPILFNSGSKYESVWQIFR